MEAKKLKRYYRIIVIICLFFLAAGTSFAVYMMKENKEKSIMYFKEATDSISSTVTNLVSSNTETLDGVAITIGQMEIIDLEHLLPVLQEINYRNSFYRMGFIDKNGKGDMVDLDGTIHREMDFSGDSFYQKALTGERALSSTIEDDYTGSYVNYYGVPVIIQGETVGVLAAADKTDSLRQILDTSMFSNGGYSNIIDSNGNYIIRSLKSPEFTKIKEIGDFDEGELNSILTELKNGEEKFIEFWQNGNKTWAVYQPLTISDWFVLGIVQESMVNGDYYLIFGITLLMASAMMIFVFLAYCMNQVQMKNEQKLLDFAYKDPLLKIDNFVKFSIDAENLLAQKEFRQAAFWYCDIDDFKIFNESFGYGAGDKMLESMAGYFQTLSSEADLFCRENADHFVGIRYYSSRKDLIQWYEKLAEKLEKYEVFENKPFRLILSMGFYCAESPELILTINEMYNRARMAQKSIKQSRNIKYAFYSDKIRNILLKDNEIEANMKHALETGCFKVYIQPKTAILEDNRIAGGEVLVRWLDPVKGLINPGAFIPLFEKNGFIIPLDRYMFQSACEWLYTYLKEGGRPIRLAVNVSRLGIFQGDFIEFYTGIKNKYHIPEGMLELEFTESLAIEDNDLLRTRIMELRKEGFVCSLDDFGAGYSSLNTLKDLPIQVLKLDMLFFKKDCDVKKARIIIQNVIHMARQLNIRTVAEGVEAVEQIEFLKNCKCDIVQGYVFGRPMPADDFKKLIFKDPRGDWGDGFQQNKH